jgi:hypothetical protein
VKARFYLTVGTTVMLRLRTRIEKLEASVPPLDVIELVFLDIPGGKPDQMLVAGRRVPCSAADKARALAQTKPYPPTFFGRVDPDWLESKTGKPPEPVVPVRR